MLYCFVWCLQLDLKTGSNYIAMGVTTQAAALAPDTACRSNLNRKMSLILLFKLPFGVIGL